MGEGLNQMYSEVSYLPKRVEDEDEDEDELGDSSSLSGASDDEYESPSDHAPSSSSSSSHLAAVAAAAAAAAASHGPLHELSSLASHLPNKRGLSKFYQGKSQSFSSFSDVSHVQDLAKKETHQAMKKKKKKMMMMKPSRSYAVGLMDDEKDENKPSFVGGPNYNYNSSCNRREAQQSGRSSCASSITKTTSGCSYFATGKPPPISTHKNL